MQLFRYNSHHKILRSFRKQIVKKLLFLSFFISSLYAQASFYIGANYGAESESFSNLQEAKASSQYLSAKLGYGSRDSYGVEFSLDFIDNKSSIFSNKDGNKYAFNVEVIKAFDFDIFFNPFVKVGFGAGSMKIERELQHNLSYGTFNAALGAYIPLGEHYDIELGYTYKNRSYEKVDMVVDSISYQSHINASYIGFNIRF